MGTETDIVIACCRDESDIVTPFIDFYLQQGFDRVCFIDNGSRDDTVTQVINHPGRDRVMLYCDPRTGYDLRLFEYYKRFEALASRWVFFIDVDEFILIPGGIKKFARELPADASVLALNTSEMIPLLDMIPADSPLMTTRRQSDAVDETKVVWKAGVANKIYCGKHAIEGAGMVLHRCAELFIRHFHTRTERQFVTKLQNRIQTETLIASTPDRGDSLSLFSRAERNEWIEYSQKLLGSDGWACEKERLARMAWMEDTSIRDWYRAWRVERIYNTERVDSSQAGECSHDKLAASSR